MVWNSAPVLEVVHLDHLTREFAGPRHRHRFVAGDQ
jgi:hypothetical protein